MRYKTLKKNSKPKGKRKPPFFKKLPQWKAFYNNKCRHLGAYLSEAKSFIKV